MIFCDQGIVLLKKNIRESDKIIALYTHSHGKIVARLPGVNKHTGKLKAVSEPFVCADYRFYMRPYAPVGCVTGAKIKTVFPSIRKNFAKTNIALYFCELTSMMTPINQPNKDKYHLLLGALNYLENAELVHSFLKSSFALRLMKLAGFGLDKPVLGIDRNIWEKIHQEDYSNLDFDSLEGETILKKADYVVERFMARHFKYPPKTSRILK
jgi:DNA repair protein RecO (recombination protein O)